MLSTLDAVTKGNLDQHLELPFEETHPLGALALSVNSMVESLKHARAESDNYSNELSTQIETIERQREAIRVLSVPIIEVWEKVLCVPIVGVLDTLRASDVTSSLLNAVVEKKARYVIIDLTGIEVMDTQSADHFLRMAGAVGLLGARCTLSGIHPNIARTIVHMGVDLEGLKSYRTMREALKACVSEQSSARMRRRSRVKAQSENC